jgi:hypothetical protein
VNRVIRTHPPDISLENVRLSFLPRLDTSLCSGLLSFLWPYNAAAQETGKFLAITVLQAQRLALIGEMSGVARKFKITSFLA